jgi:predicted DNA-binding mobile mystery protein A
MNKKYKQIAQEQNSQIINDAAVLASVRQPKQGWIKTLRVALSLSGAALSKRLGGHRSTAFYLENSEINGSITLKKMQQTAEAMGCRFIYGIVPPKGKSIDDLINQQAEKVARSVVDKTSVHMMLEDQLLSPKLKQKEIERLKVELLAQMPRDFWGD